MIYQFGSGNLYGATGTAPLVPRKFGALQDVSVDFGFTLKELYGQNQFPLTIARGQAKIAGKAKFASLHGGTLNDLFFGASNAAGRKEYVNAEGPTAIPATPFQITVANAANFYEDLGVTVVSTGVPMVRVASAPAAGQYSVTNAGVYTFSSADNVSGLSVYIDYSYTVAASGNTTTIVNALMGTTPAFVATFPIKFNGKTLYLRLNQCISSKLTLATKLDDFLVPEFDFSAFADAANNIGTLSLTE